MAQADIFIFAVNSVLPVILLVALGYILKKTNFFTAEFLRVANKTVFRVLLPVLLFVNLAELDSFSQLKWDAVLYALAAIAILFCIGLFLAHITSDRCQKGVMLQGVVRSNFALVGVPLAQLMAGDKGVQSAALLSAFTIPVFNVLSVIALSVYIQGESGGKGRMAKTLRGDIAQSADHRRAGGHPVCPAETVGGSSALRCDCFYGKVHLCGHGFRISG